MGLAVSNRRAIIIIAAANISESTVNIMLNYGYMTHPINLRQHGIKMIAETDKKNLHAQLLYSSKNILLLSMPFPVKGNDFYLIITSLCRKKNKLRK